MKYQIEEIIENDENTFLISDYTFDKKALKKALEEKRKLELDFDFLSLGTKLYKSNKKETIVVQKENCKKVINVYKALCKIIRIAKRKKYDFNGTFVVKNLNAKQNNNDFLIESLLSLKYNTLPFARLNKSVLYTCDFLDKENSMHNMCDFHDNKCAKHRARGFERSTGCCPASCKFMDNCPCKTKNLSCKLIMCDYLVNMGYYFTPHTIPILKKHLTFFERVASIGMFFKSTKRTYLFMWNVRILSALILLAIGLTIVSLFI